MNLKEIYRRLRDNNHYDLSSQENVDIDALKDRAYSYLNLDQINQI